MDSQRRLWWIAAAVIISVIVATVYVTQIFLAPILWGAFIAYILYPVHSHFVRITGHKHLSSLLTMLLVCVIFIAIIIGVANVAVTEASKLSESQYVIYDAVDNFVNGLAEEYIPAASEYTEEIGTLAKQILTKLFLLVADIVTRLAATIPLLIAQFGVAILLVYYLLIDGESVIENILDLLPEKKLTALFFGELKPIYHTLFHVYFNTCILSGVIASAGFFLLGVPYPILWGVAMAIFALLPLVGTNTLIIPMTIYYLLVHDYTMAVALFAFGMIFLNLIPDYVIRPQLAKSGAAIHPAITLLAFIAPIFMLGMVGIVIGPALYGFLLAAYRTNLRLREEGVASVQVDTESLESTVG
ncbi:MAG TPA: AI-2E family transporter [Methanosarcinales archaeon]|nr:AI-2E family transporter [Methanosarcinales archaeon]